ncbi:MAG: single-stranded-DNA-specific exonuclease RecJ [Candidatus Sericytochromatia bacterium]|nr:single-stranded-DNA-specific exonuclease RecJ [Candidatus Sericytochromatia bacterium]
MWRTRESDAAVVATLQRELGLSAPLAAVLAGRGRTHPEDARAFLDAREDLSRFRHPFQSTGLDTAVVRLEQALSRGERIGLYGDYDCDGVTSSAILWRYLARRRKGHIVLRLPDRFVDGYGLHPQAVEHFASEGCRVVLTCDNGISAYPAAERARELGLDLVVTDHHQIGQRLPPAAALVHPGLDFPEARDLCGAGVALALVVAMEGGLTPELMWLLDLVALGTVGDVVPVDGINRPLLWAGLQRIREGKCTPGTLALARACDVDPTGITARQLGFQLVPRLNAPGRLETPDAGFRLLTSNDPDEQDEIARQLGQVNAERRALVERQWATIRPDAEAWDLARQPVMVLAGNDFHAGVTGLVASRLVERYGTAVLLLAPGPDGTWKGSGRSPDGFHLAEALAACDHLLKGHGGHANAAGCSIQDEYREALTEALNAHARAVRWAPRPQGSVTLDAELSPADLTLALADDLEQLEPTGRGNERPQLGWLRARISHARTLKDRHVFLQLEGMPEHLLLKYWNGLEAGLQPGMEVSVAVGIKARTWQGHRQLDLTVDRISPCAPTGGPDTDLAAAVRLLCQHLEGMEGIDLFLQGRLAPLTEEGLKEAYAFLRTWDLILPGPAGRQVLAGPEARESALSRHARGERPPLSLAP